MNGTVSFRNKEYQDGCVYICDEDKNSEKYRNKCRNTQMCENGTCVTVDLNTEEVYVDLILEKVKAEDMNETELRNAIEVFVNVKADEMRIISESDDEGYIIRVIVIVPDLEIARILAAAVNDNCVGDHFSVDSESVYSSEAGSF